MLSPQTVKRIEALLRLFEIYNMRHHETAISFSSESTCVGRRLPHFKQHTQIGSLNLNIVPHIRCSWAPICVAKSKIFNILLIHPNLKIERFIFASLYQFLGIFFLSPCCCCAPNYVHKDSTEEWTWIVRGSSCHRELNCSPFSGRIVRKKCSC